MHVCQVTRYWKNQVLTRLISSKTNVNRQEIAFQIRNCLNVLKPGPCRLGDASPPKIARGVPDFEGNLPSLSDQAKCVFLCYKENSKTFWFAAVSFLDDLRKLYASVFLGVRAERVSLQPFPVGHLS